MADITTTFTIPSEKAPDALTFFLEVKPNNETMLDPNWVDPKDGSQQPEIAKYTAKQWVKEAGLRWYKAVLKEGKKRIDKKSLSNINPDDYIN